MTRVEGSSSIILALQNEIHSQSQMNELRRTELLRS
jgi:hypothetical protein